MFKSIWQYSVGGKKLEFFDFFLKDVIGYVSEMFRD